MQSQALPLDLGSLPLLTEALRTLAAGFDHLPTHRETPDLEAMREVLHELAVRMRDNYPYHHPLYAGQMIKPPHPVARLAYALSLWVNPNNHALDGGRATSHLEREAVAEIAGMFRWNTHLGHLCGGGTMANLEALWASGQLRPGQRIAASSQAHYTHERISAVLGLEFTSVATDALGRMDLAALERALACGDVGTVVVTAGTTAVGAVDPLPDVLALKKRFDFRVHVDAAYGGYFTLARNLTPHARAAFDALAEADSIVVDPHKHGLQPYGCGCVLFRDPSVGALYKHDSPYTYFTSDALHLGEISLECSRPGAAAAALWATMRMLPLTAGGSFAEGLERSRQAALRLHERLREDDRFIVPFSPELDIVVFAARDATSSGASKRANHIFRRAADDDLHLALAKLPRHMFKDDVFAWDSDTVTCLRSVLMKPEHDAWLDTIWRRLDQAASD